MKRNFWFLAVLICLIAWAVLFPAGAAHAVEGGSGVYALGLVGPQAGIMPEPGTYVGYNLYYYKGDTTTPVSASGKVQIPGTGFELPAQLTGSVDTEAESYAHIVTLTYVFDADILGGRPGVSVWLPYVDSDLTLRGSGVLSLTGPLGGTYDIPFGGRADASETDIGDTTFIGMLLARRISTLYDHAQRVRPDRRLRQESFDQCG
ncbi:hypothetical protein [Desulfosarcina cetonica]|uniref:hypothetical protein n=1 Tax=Desulfosarcina cetonica TaxID=90730 RepID=UPI0006D22169|nr:hypothetical protein [Desulfosarcina cetonica]